MNAPRTDNGSGGTHVNPPDNAIHDVKFGQPVWARM